MTPTSLFESPRGLSALALAALSLPSFATQSGEESKYLSLDGPIPSTAATPVPSSRVATEELLERDAQRPTPTSARASQESAMTRL